MPNIVLDEVASGYKVSTINENFEKIEQALNSKVLYRETSEPNSMGQSLDANNFPVINVRTPKYNKEAANKLYVDAAIEQALSGVEAGTIDFELLIDRVGDAEAAITTEKLVRASEDEALASSVTQLNASVGQVSADIVQEATARATADSAIASTLDSVSAITNTNSANITAETTARTNQYTALASDITTLQANVGSNTAAITNEQTARVNADNALASSITSLTSQVNTNTAAISSEASTRASADTAIASSVTSLTATVNSNTAAISNEATTRADADSAISSSVSTVSANLGTLSSSVTTQMSAVNTRLGGMESKYTLTVDSGGRISGFESVANPDSSTFTVKADLFKLSMPGYGDYVPFAIGPSDVLFNGVTNWSGVTGSGKPQDNATYGANADSLNIGLGVNLLANTEFIGGFAPAVMGWNPGGVSPLALRGDDVWRPKGGQALEMLQLGRSGNIYNIGADTYLNGSYGDYHYGIPVTAGKRYEFSAKLAAHRCDYWIGIVFFDVAGTALEEFGSGFITPRLTGGPTFSANAYGSGWTHAVIFRTAPAGAAFANVYWRKSDTDVGQAESVAWLCQPFFGEALASQTAPSTYSPGYAKGAFSSLDKLTTNNIVTYMDNATINTAQIANAAIKSAQIGDAEIGTLKIAGEAVTVPRLVVSEGRQRIPAPETWVEVSRVTVNNAGTVLLWGWVHWTLYSYPYAGPLRFIAPSGAVLETAQPFTSNESGVFVLQAWPDDSGYVDVDKTRIVAIGMKR